MNKNILNIENNRLFANFPVFDETGYINIVEALYSVIEKETDLMKEYSDIAAELLTEHCPPSVRDQCGTIAAISYRLDTAAIIFETLVKDGIITIPDKKIPLTIWGVKK